MQSTPSAAHAIDPPRVEFATLFVAAAIYGGWIAATLVHDRLSPWILPLVGGWLLAWHGSLQHETIHGHPTPWRWANTLLAFAPLNLWLPYQRYRQTHQAHHAAEHLTEPGSDPESRYLSGAAGGLRRWVARASATLLGRLTLGPLIEIAGFLAAEIRAVAADEAGVRRAWAIHLAAVAGVLFWLIAVCRFSLSGYVAAFVYPGCALSLLRSFAEHRADPVAARRIAVVERAPILGLLFLNNNLHAAHHAFPHASWRRLPGLYAQHRESLLSDNGGLVYRGYGEVVRRYLLSPHDVIVHPGRLGLDPAVGGV